MADVWLPALLSIAAISAISLVGLLALSFTALRRHGFIFALVALAAGTLIGDAFFHLLPETIESAGGLPLSIGAVVVVGFLAFYALEALLRWGHAHGELAHANHAGEPAAKPFGYLNLIGDAVHNFLDGIVVAAAFLVDPTVGIATAVAVAIHELPQEFGDFAVLLRAGFSVGKAAMFNLLSAFFAFAGAVLMLAVPFEPDVLEGMVVPFVAGGFLYIAAADLVPELHHHTRRGYVQVAMGFLIIGTGIMAALTLLE